MSILIKNINKHSETKNAMCKKKKKRKISLENDSQILPVMEDRVGTPDNVTHFCKKPSTIEKTKEIDPGTDGVRTIAAVKKHSGKKLNLIKKTNKKLLLKDKSDYETTKNQLESDLKSCESLKQNEVKGDFNSDNPYKCHKNKKLKTELVKKNPEISPLQTTMAEFGSENKKKKEKVRMFPGYKDQLGSDVDSSGKVLLKKKRLLHNINDEYKPGMLSELLQIKKYGRLIIPWDPSFGLDPVYNEKLKEMQQAEKGQPQLLKINPLFDLSKRTKISPSNDSENKVFVGNLPHNVTLMELKKLFKKCGHFKQIKVSRKENKRQNKLNEEMKSKKQNNPVHAVIRFKSSGSCETALKLNGKLYKGHHLRVTLSSEEGSCETSYSIFIGNLSFDAQDEDLWEAFGDCGSIKSVRVVKDQQTGKGKGFGYINFETADSVEEALKLNGTKILNRKIRVSERDSGASSLSDLITIKRRNKNKKPLSKSDETTSKKQFGKVTEKENKIEVEEAATILNKKKKKKKKSKEDN